MHSLCILGMHRSGTSCLTGILQNLGVELGEVFTQNPFNLKGNREHPRIMALNNNLLEYNQGGWDEPVDVSQWTDEHLRERDAIVALLKENTHIYWGFKDPRTLLTFDFWLPVLDFPRFIGTFRHPIKVALSLQQRNGFTFDQGFALWQAYNQRLLMKSRQYGFPLVNFDLDDDNYLTDVLNKISMLDLCTQKFTSAKSFFDTHLRHQTDIDSSSQQLPQDILMLYQQLVRTASDNPYLSPDKQLFYSARHD